VIELIRAYFECGSIRPDRSDKTLKWETRRLNDIVVRVLPHFHEYPLISGKQQDVALLWEICRIMKAGNHRTKSGLLEIARMANRMNPSGVRRYSLAAIEATVR